MSYPFYLFFALFPSFIWLFYYLSKDIHPEPKRMILKIFSLGMLAVIPVVFLEREVLELLEKLDFLPFYLFLIIHFFLITALIEELIKYLIIRIKVIKNKNFDEPIDAMVYMIVAGLGFAAMENLFVFWPLMENIQIFTLLMFSIFRFIGAVFLHALCSGTIGYFLGLSFFDKNLIRKTKKKLVIMGLLIAIFFHGLYNFFIMSDKGDLRLIMPLIILVGLGLFVSWGFKKLKLINDSNLSPKNQK